MVLAGLPILLPKGSGAAPLEICGQTPLLVHRRYETVVRNYGRDKQIPLNLFCVSDEVLPLLTWAGNGLGIAVVPEFAPRLLSPSTLEHRVISQPVVDSSSALIWNKEEELPAAAAHFVEEVMQEQGREE
jgi:DNA-binding transcriptional LysR family regulator